MLSPRPSASARSRLSRVDQRFPSFGSRVKEKASARKGWGLALLVGTGGWGTSRRLAHCPCCSPRLRVLHKSSAAGRQLGVKPSQAQPSVLSL